MILKSIIPWLLLLTTSANATDASSDPTRKELSILCLNVITPLRDGKLCKAAVEIVQDAVNANPNILQNYAITFDFKDGNPDDSIAVTQTFDFFDSFVATSSKVPSPLIMGVSSKPVCRSFGAVADKLGIVILSHGCAGSLFSAQRQLYPNLWRSEMSWDNFVIPTVQFITRLGNWSKVGILSDTTGGLTTGLEIYRWLGKANIIVVYYDIASAPGSDEIMDQLKASNARIIIVYMSDLAPLLNFYCAAYRKGIRGSKYAFIQPINIFTSLFNGSPLNLPPGCTRNVIQEQVSLSFRIGESSLALFNNGPTSLGYDLVEFEKLFDAKTNSSRTADYDSRHDCHDWALNAVMALDLAESKLQNMSLSLSDWKTQPYLVAGIVNSSMLEVQLRDLRNGLVELSPRAEREENIQEIYQSINGKDTVNYIVRNTKHLYGVDNVDMDTFSWQEISNVRWQSGPNPPADFPQFLNIVKDIPLGVFGMAVTLAVLLKIIQVVLLLRQNQHYKIMSNMRLELSWFFLNAAAVLFSVPFAICPFAALCYAQRVVLTLGISLLLGLLVGMLIPIFRAVRKLADVLLLARLSEVSHFTDQSLDAANITARVSFSFSYFVATVLPSVVTLFVWMSLDTFDISPRKIGSDSYDLSTDAYTKTFVRGCSSILGNYFAASLLGIFIIELFAVSLIAYITMTNIRRSGWHNLQSLSLDKSIVRCLLTVIWTMAAVSSPSIIIIALLELLNGPAISSIILSICLVLTSACLTLAWNMPKSWTRSMFKMRQVETA